MRTGTKFWLAAGTILLMVLLLVIYILIARENTKAEVVGAFLGVITLTVGGYFTSNVVASGQPAPTIVNSDKPPGS